MKFKKIVGFGDSWMFGDELLDPVLASSCPDADSSWTQNIAYRERHCALGLLGKHYGVPTENFGIPGGSLRSTVWTYLWWLEHETLPLDECLVLIYLTEADRESFYDSNYQGFGSAPPWDKFVNSTWVEFGSSVITEDYRDLAKRFMVLCTSRELSQLNYKETVYFFEGQHHIHKIPMLQVHAAKPPCAAIPASTLIWPEFNWVRYFLDRPDNQNREYYKPNGHPNEIGHQIMADMLQAEIDRAILQQCSIS